MFYWTIYSMGLRLDETRNLQVGDVDGKRMMVHIHRGKGAKDRYVPLPAETLLGYFHSAPGDWLGAARPSTRRLPKSVRCQQPEHP
ncbi:tyrosine-type recombinase/integrase [Allorhodopirellula heiligendammensis]|uniref:tyrosine-type recombinase/integrase n=1 Tax=Allorhodopirellula heiligendammensis TaxID=2714739 RepID=UPI00345E5AD0